ncbi:hypothetical protein ACFLV4_05510, partial [Chloroflexota bacterium]
YDIDSDIYEGNVRLVIPSLAGVGQLMEFKKSLEKVRNLSIILFGGSVDEGRIIVVSVQNPMALIRVLSEMPTVDEVRNKGKSIVVTLKTSAVI